METYDIDRLAMDKPPTRALNPEEYLTDAYLVHKFPEGGLLKPPQPGTYHYHKYLIDHVKEFEAFALKLDKHKDWYAFTLTTNEIDKILWPNIENAMKQAAHKILTQLSQPVVAGAAYLEYQDSGAPHIHGYYHLNEGKRIYPKTFKRYWPLWNEAKRLGLGHVGGYHKLMSSGSYKDYAGAEERLVSKI